MGSSKHSKSLKSALLSHQKRQTHNVQQAAKHAAMEAKGKHADKAGKSKKRTRVESPRKATVPFVPTDRILLIGEGNFSFAHSLLDHPSIPSLPPVNITATAYDSESDCLAKYPDAQAHIAALRSAGTTVLFGVDARHLDKTFPLKTARKWDKVVWNFPHVGLSIADQDRNIAANQSTLLGFLASVKPYLAEGAIPDPNAKGKGVKKDNEMTDDDDDEGSMVSPRESRRKMAGSVLITLREQDRIFLQGPPSVGQKPSNPCNIEECVAPTSLCSVLRYSRRGLDYNWTLRYEHRRTSGWDEKESPLVGASKSCESGNHEERGSSRTWEFVLRPDQ
ncbi:hypothetical protein AG1IA_07941 [Rhizoctonia solani AG-1 IA]|uniref:25S rRNA (uridine-N(3))-methyltransferase BMT5-like domain-containing protein n=1 Tax=Thanatephorus cucumeris (strain AG1-IA) TaxID=983506 RepID=L8WJB4_THACA|nr:hypothetical protein AG1IA_07941 [Rhizoctonia solani AG-1 IA]